MGVQEGSHPAAAPGQLAALHTGAVCCQELGDTAQPAQPPSSSSWGNLPAFAGGTGPAPSAGPASLALLLARQTANLSRLGAFYLSEGRACSASVCLGALGMRS